MENISSLIKDSPLFLGIGIDDLNTMLLCLGARQKTIEKGATLFLAGDTLTAIGLLASGRLHLIKSDIWGNNAIVAEVTPPGMFAESVVCGGLGQLPVSIVAKEASAVLFLDFQKIVTACSSSCAFHAKLIRNMVGVLACKNMHLVDKIEHLTKRTIKEKLLSYLYAQAGQSRAKAFDIPYNRQELADYLSVERSALSAEMSRLRAVGIIDYKKNHFELF